MSCTSANPPIEIENDPIEIDEISINGTLISPEDIAREVQYHPANSPEEGINLATEALIIRTLLLQQAKKLGITVNNSDSKNGSNDNQAEEMIISMLIDQEASAPQASNEECQRYFEANRNKFRTSDLLEVRHILLATDPDNEQQQDKAKQSAIALIKTLQQSPEKFSELTREYSDCPSKEAGGSLGQLSKGQTTPEFEQQVFPLNQGLAKHPITTRYGYHVVCVDRKIPGQPLEFSHVSEKIAQYLNEVSQRKIISQYLRILISEAEITGIELNPDNSPLLQ